VVRRIEPIHPDGLYGHDCFFCDRTRSRR